MIAFGFDPTDGASVSPVIVPLDPATGTFTYTRRAPALSGLSYAIQITTTLAPGGWTTDATASQNVIETVGKIQTVRVTLTGAPLAAPMLFARIVASE